MSMAFVITIALGLGALLFWATMTDRIVPTNPAKRTALNVVLAVLALAAVIFAFAWVVLVGSFVFN